MNAVATAAKKVCEAKVALRGFEKGHDWRPIGLPTVGSPRRSSPGTSTCMVCIRCGENGWKLT